MTNAETIHEIRVRRILGTHEELEAQILQRETSLDSSSNDDDTLVPATMLGLVL